MEKYDPHGRAERLKSLIGRLEQGKYGLSEEATKLLLGFNRDLIAEGLSVVRTYKYIETLVRLTKKLKKPYGKMTKEDIKDFIIELEATQYSEWTKHDYKMTLRRFYKWFKGNNQTYPEEVDWIKVYVKDRHKLPEELLTGEEIKKMILAANNPRDRTLVECLSESGCRISELLTLQLKNVKFDKYGAVIQVTGKTGGRRVRLVSSVPSLTRWLEFHPFKDNPEAYLFAKKRSESDGRALPFRYEYALRVIKNLAKKVGIRKNVHPHLFRHSRATVLASKLTEAQMKEYFGWTQGSSMAATYVHLSGRDVDDAILGLYKIKQDGRQEDEELKPIICARCKSTNSSTSKFCSRCSYDLNVNAAAHSEQGGKNADDILKSLMKDPQFQEMIMKKLMERPGEAEVIV